MQAKGGSPRKGEIGRDKVIQSVVFDLISHEMLEYFISQPKPLDKKSKEFAYNRNRGNNREFRVPMREQDLAISFFIAQSSI